MDRLKLMCIKKWPAIRSILKSDFPRSVPGFSFLENMEDFENRGIGYGAKVYCPLGDASNGVVAINDKNQLYEIIIQCPKDDTRELEEALKTTKVIDWNRDIKVPFAPKHVMQCIRNVIKEKDIIIKDLIPGVTFVKYTDEPLFDVSIPENYSFQPLSIKYLEIVNSNWPHNYPGSEQYIELLINANLGYGLFKDNELLSSGFVKEIGDLGILYTNKEHRNKGYGKLITSLVSDVTQKKGRNVFFSCIKTNTAALNLYKILGFAEAFEEEWCYLTRKK